MITPVNNEGPGEFWINNNDMNGEQPNFTKWQDKDLINGCLAINMDTKKGYAWDAETLSWKKLN